MRALWRLQNQEQEEVLSLLQRQTRKSPPFCLGSHSLILTSVINLLSPLSQSLRMPPALRICESQTAEVHTQGRLLYHLG